MSEHFDGSVSEIIREVRAAARLAGKLEGLELAANWLRRQANAETKPEGRAAFIEAHNAIRTIIAEIEKGEGDMTLEEGVAALRKVTRKHGGLNFSVEDWKAEREAEAAEIEKGSRDA